MSKLLKENRRKDDIKAFARQKTLKLFKMKEIEVLLLKKKHLMALLATKIRIKINKGTFGSLAILNTIANELNYASLNKFKALCTKKKLHTAGLYKTILNIGLVK